MRPFFAVALALAALSGPAARAGEVVDCASLLASPDADLDQLVDAGCELTAEQIGRLMDNPVGELVMMPIQYDRLTIEEPFFGTRQTIQSLKAIPTFPVRLGDWNLINRAVFSYYRLPVDAGAFTRVSLQPDSSDVTIDGPPLISDPFAGSSSGFGDIAYVGLFTPRKSSKLGEGKFIWAAGPTFIFPTASEDLLGQGKYQAGPAGAIAYLGKDWTLGLFAQHWWSIGGDDQRSSISQTNVQYFVYRKLDDQWAVGASPTISIDWTAEDSPRVNFPVGIGINKTLFLGPVPARVGVEATYYVSHADKGLEPEWGLRFSITPVVPAAFLR